VNPLFIIALVIWAISSIALVILVLMHSGKGAGLSETFGGSMDPNIGTGMIEKNLNRITIICASIFIATLIAMVFLWPSPDYPDYDDGYMDIPGIEEYLDQEIMLEDSLVDLEADDDVSTDDAPAGDEITDEDQ